MVNAGQELYANRTPLSFPPDKNCHSTRKEADGTWRGVQVSDRFSSGVRYGCFVAQVGKTARLESCLLDFEVGVQDCPFCKMHHAKSLGRTHGDDSSSVRRYRASFYSRSGNASEKSNPRSR